MGENLKDYQKKWRFPGGYFVCKAHKEEKCIRCKDPKDSYKWKDTMIEFVHYEGEEDPRFIEAKHNQMYGKEGAENGWWIYVSVDSRRTPKEFHKTGCNCKAVCRISASNGVAKPQKKESKRPVGYPRGRVL